jgi:hypothetical protein
MAFPNLLPKPDARAGKTSDIWAENTGQPDNGNNTIGLPFVAQGVDPNDIDEDWLDLYIEALGPSVTAANFVSLAPDKQSMVVNFTQGGTDNAYMRVRSYHSVIS